MARLKKYFYKFDRHMQDVLRSLSVAFIVKILGAGLTFFLNVAISRILGADGAGIYFLALAIATLGSVFARVGLDGAMLRFVSTKAAVEDWGGVITVYGIGIRIALVGAALVTLIIYALTPFVADNLFSKPELIDPLRWMSLSILPFTILTLEAESLKGVRKIREAMIVQGVGLPLISLILLFPMAMLYKVEGVALSYLISSAMVALLGAWYWFRFMPKEKANPIVPFTRSDIFKSCFPLFFVSIIGRGILPNAPLLLLGVWGTTADVGIFSAAQRFALLVGFLLSTVNSVVAPKFAELYTKNEFVLLASTARQTTLLIAAIATPMFLALVFGSHYFMLIFGKEFVTGSTALSILAAGQFVNILCGSVGQLLVISGRESILRNVTIISALTTIILGILLIPWLGINGAAIASAVSLAGMSLTIMLLVKKELGVKILF